MNKARRERIDKRKALKEWSLKVRERDKHKCQMCGSTKHLNAHHIIPKEFAETRFELMNGITLCVRCHKFGLKSAHKNGFYFVTWLYLHKPEQASFLKDKILESIDNKAILLKKAKPKDT